MYATEKQIALIAKLAERKGMSPIAASDAYGLGLKAARDLTKRDASELIDWLLGKSSTGIKVSAEGQAKADARDAEFRAKYPNLS